MQKVYPCHLFGNWERMQTKPLSRVLSAWKKPKPPTHPNLTPVLLSRGVSAALENPNSSVFKGCAGRWEGILKTQKHRLLEPRQD